MSKTTQPFRATGRYEHMVEDVETVRRLAKEETERAIVAWIRAQVAVARSEKRTYIAQWLDRLAVAIERGEYRSSGARHEG